MISSLRAPRALGHSPVESKSQGGVSGTAHRVLIGNTHNSSESVGSMDWRQVGFSLPYQRNRRREREEKHFTFTPNSL